MRPNAIFILIDALRYDVAKNPQATSVIAPNLAKIAKRGFTNRVVANAQSTQFVMPSLFSLTYPLDHGGYNNGIQGRPASFVECLSKAGYETHLVAACNQIGITLGYNRGFNTVHTAADYRHILSYRIEKTLQYELDLVARGEKSEADALAVIGPDLEAILDAIPRNIAETNTTSWPKRLRRINARVARLCADERRLLNEAPNRVLHKLRTLPPALYWRCLGRTEFSAWERFRWRVSASIDWRFRALAVKLGFPLFPLGHFQVVAADIVPSICRMLASFRQPWFMYIHLMDVHDCASLNRPWNLLNRLRYLPRWYAAKRKGLTLRTFRYDSALMDVDAKIGRIMAALKENGQYDDTILFVTGDHGNGAAHSPRSTKKGLGHRTHFEDIDVSLFVSHNPKKTAGDGLLDSMGVTATLLDMLEVPSHPSFKGKTLFGPGSKAVISENAGRGNADLKRRDLYFTITTSHHKLMATLKGAQVSCQELYDLKSDPQELRNIVDCPANKTTVHALLAILSEERGDLLSMRGAAP